MSFRKLTSIAFIIAAALCTLSCKDDDESTVPPSLSGAMAFNLPEYIFPESVIKMVPSGVTHPDGEELGYYWKVSPTMKKSDTTRFENGLDKNGNPSDGSFTHKFSDTLQTYTVQGYAYAKGYSYLSKTSYTNVVKGGIDGSITNLELKDKPSVTAGSVTYPYVTIGSTDWLCRNIADASAGAPYGNNIAMSDVFGRYYSYEEALEVCPEGWQLPTEADWLEVAAAAGTEDAQAYDTISGVAAALMGNAYFNDSLMWEYWPEVGDITNSTGLSLIPTGYAMLGARASSPQEDEYVDNRYPQAQFLGYKEYAAFWTADKVEEEEGMAYYRYLISKQPDLMINKGDTKTFGAAVRCVRKTAE